MTQVAAVQYFTDREGFIERFGHYINGPANESLRVLVFYGVGGIGKTALLQKLCRNLYENDPQIPHARFNLENVGDSVQAYRQVLLSLRSDLDTNCGIQFPRFDLCWALMMAREGGEPPALLRIRPSLNDAFQFAAAVLAAPLSGIDGFVKRAVKRFPTVERWVRRVGGTEDVIDLKNRAMKDDQTLPDELIRRFAQDLQENLPPRDGKACCGALFLDTYEALWSGRESGASAQARLLDDWVRQLAEYCLRIGVMLVIGGRDRLAWVDDDPDWDQFLDQHLLGGLSAHDAQEFLAKCGIGNVAEQPPSPLQGAIVNCCDVRGGHQGEVSCHPFFLALCAETVVSFRNTKGNDPPLDTFTGIPTDQVASTLATRFLKSLHSRAMESWLEEMSLGASFDEQAALALDAERQYHNGRAGWELLRRFSFVEPQPDGFYRLHKTMQDALRTRVGDDAARVVHQWFLDYWTNRNQPALAWLHRWTLDPIGAIEEWTTDHESAMKEMRIGDARKLFSYWSTVPLDEVSRQRIGELTHRAMRDALADTPLRQLQFFRRWLDTVVAKDGSDDVKQALTKFVATPFDLARLGELVWSLTHKRLGDKLAQTRLMPRQGAMTAAIAHYRAALQVVTETNDPGTWGAIQNNLALAYDNLTCGNRAENISMAIPHYEAALRVFKGADSAEDYATTLNNLATAYLALPTGDREGNLNKAKGCLEEALRVCLEAHLPPRDLAHVQVNLGTVYGDLDSGCSRDNLNRAIEWHQAALRALDEGENPLDWARIQQCLASDHVGLASLEEDEDRKKLNLGKAAEFLQQALRFRTEADFPEDWARGQADLALIYLKLSRLVEPRGELVRQAVTGFKSALRVLHETDLPAHWAKAKHGEACALAMLVAETHDPDLLLEVKACLVAAVRGYESVGLDKEAEKSRDLLLAIDELKGETGPLERS